MKRGNPRSERGEEERKGEGRKRQIRKICSASQRSSHGGSTAHDSSPHEHSVHESARLAADCPLLTVCWGMCSVSANTVKRVRSS